MSLKYEADTAAVADMIGVPAHTIRNWAARGKLQPLRTEGTRTIYDAETVVRLAARHGYIPELPAQPEGCCYPSCDGTAWPDMEIPLCRPHAIAVWLRINDEWNKRLPPVDPSSLPPRQPVVYFIQSGELIKIGTTADLTGRLGQLNTTAPEKLKILLVVAGGRTEEKQTHALFAAERVRGEWFRPSERLLEFIADRAGQDIRTVHGGSLPGD